MESTKINNNDQTDELKRAGILVIASYLFKVPALVKQLPEVFEKHGVAGLGFVVLCFLGLYILIGAGLIKQRRWAVWLYSVFFLSWLNMANILADAHKLGNFEVILCIGKFGLDCYILYLLHKKRLSLLTLKLMRQKK